MRILPLFIWTCLVLAASAANRPFVLPVAARAFSSSEDGRGWQETGVARMTYVQAKGQFRATLAQAGWRFLHAVAFSTRNDRVLLTWRKGSRELTMMVWRIDVDRTGFSWGISRKSNERKNHEDGKQ